MFGFSSCSYVPEKEIYNLTLSDYENSYNFSIPINSTSTETLIVYNELPKVDYNFSTYDFNIDISSRFSRERYTSHSHVFLIAYIPHEYFTFSFDPNNSDNITSDNDNINNIVFLRPFPDINSYTSTEIAISCLFGINVVNYQLMVPRYNISKCINSYLEERSIESTAFYSHLEIGQPPSYPCSDVLDAVKILFGNIFTDMVINLTANPDPKAKRHELNNNSWVLIILSLLGLPAGKGQGIRSESFYLEVFPLLETITSLMFSFWHKDNSGPFHNSCLLPICFYEFADILLSFEDNSTEIFRKSLKITDNMVNRNHSLLINQTFEELVNFQNVNNSEEFNNLHDFCVVASCYGEHECHYLPIFCLRRSGYLDYGNFITKWGSNISNNVHDNHTQPSDVSIVDLCNTTDADDSLGLSSIEYHDDDFYCHDGNNACFGT
ncbi:7980_t:CDS:2 [Dentiscutata heterogama]|uniref:7980_t:CDS:1 n=1 Tax=Dentiscutata heterogama TaxID=1316150 RepID=A0ACA9K804_9GLOM|nr:7980_t:CDS:2 [Dentiscutata heterogama]